MMEIVFYQQILHLVKAQTRVEPYVFILLSVRRPNGRLEIFYHSFDVTTFCLN